MIRSARCTIIVAGMVLAGVAGQVQGQQTAPATQPIVAPAKAGEYLTQEQLVQAYREKQYLLIVRETTRILENPKIVERYNRFNVLVLRAESFLQTKNFDSATGAFDQAAEEAPDDDKKAAMLATVELIEKRTGLQYLPKTTDEEGVPLNGQPGKKGAGIELLDLGKREAAFYALFWDEVAGMQQMIAGRGSLNKVGAAMTRLDKVAFLERASRGGQEETKKLRAALAVAAEGILARQIKEYEAMIGKKRETALQQAHSQTGEPFGPIRGLNATDVRDLQDAIATLEKIPKGTEELVARLGTDPTLYDGVVKEAAKVKEAARSVLLTYPEVMRNRTN